MVVAADDDANLGELTRSTERLEEMHEETYLIIPELTTGGASSGVRPNQGGNLMPILQGASSEVAGRTDDTNPVKKRNPDSK